MSKSIKWLREEYIELLINSSSDIIFLKDKDFRYLIANKAYEKLFDVKVEDIIGKTDFDFMPKKVAEGCRRSDREALKSGFISREEWVGEKCFHVIKQKVIDVKRESIGIAAVIRDITEYKQIEKKLKESKEFAEGLIASMKDGLSILDSRGVHININEALCKMTGFSREELIGVGPPHPYWPPEEYKNIQRTFKKTLRGEFEDFELIFMRKNGERFPVIVSPSWLKNERGEIISYIATVKDITERKRIENMYRESEERLRNIIASSPDAITITDLNGNITDCSQATLKMHGFSTKKELIGKSAFNLIAKRDRSKALKNLKKTLKQGFVKNIEYTLLTKDGREFPAELSASVIRDLSDKPRAFVAITKDITERKQLDRAKNEFVSLASHQLRTPLTIMNWYSEMLLTEKGGKINPKQKKYVEEIYTANQRLVRLTNLLLNISRIEIGTLKIEPKPTKIINIADNVLKEFLPEIKNKKLKIKKNYDKKLPVVNVDPDIIRIIFQNLFSNAIKYTSKGGKVRLSIKGEKSDVVIKVSDTGYGIPKAQQSQIFTKFFRADNIIEKEPTGTGLGLYIVKSLLEQSGGKIWFESEENKGTTFYVTIPLKGMKKQRGTRRLDL